MQRLSILICPGGTDFSYQPYSRLGGPTLRMYAFGLSLQARYGRAVKVAYPQYRVVGWNGGQASPLPYARNRFNQLVATAPDVPVVVIGHSMGGRVVAHLAADERVQGVVALAPWWQYADWRLINDHARVLAIHGTNDTLTRPKRTAKGIAELHARGNDAEFVEIPGGGHAMLDHIGIWQRAVLDFVGRELSHTSAGRPAAVDPVDSPAATH